MKKIQFFVILTALLILFAACTGNNAPAQTTEGPIADAPTDAPETDPIPEQPSELKLSENGKSEFFIVYPEDFDNAIKDVALELKNQIQKYIGANVKIISDKIMEKPVGDFGVEYQYEILLGPTNREASVNAHKNYRSRDYAVTFDGDKVVLAGITVDTVDKACDRFISFVIIKQSRDNQGKSTVIMTDADKYSFTYKNYSVGSCTVLGSDLSEYDIVYEKDDIYSAERNARLFAYELSNKAGYALDLETNPNSEKKQIIFGASETVTTRHGYTVRAEGNTLYVSAECADGYSAAYKYLTGTLFKGEKVDIAEGFSYSGVADISEMPEADQRSGEYRVIFNNIYGNHKSEHPILTRNQMTAELHYEYLPDVICQQEASEYTSPYFVFLTGRGYSKVDVEVNNSNKHNYTPMLYLTDKFEVIDKGYHLFDDGAGDKSKSVTWAVFKDKASGDIFAVGSTHFYWTSDDLGKAARLKDAEQVVTIAEMIKEKYDCPFIIGGDFNCRVGSDPLAILTSAGFKYLQKISPDTVDITTHHSYAEYDQELKLYLTPMYSTNPYSKAIDHAFAFNEIKLVPKMFRVILHDYTFLSSDHCPILVDFDIN